MIRRNTKRVHRSRGLRRHPTEHLAIRIPELALTKAEGNSASDNGNRQCHNQNHGQHSIIDPSDARCGHCSPLSASYSRRRMRLSHVNLTVGLEPPLGNWERSQGPWRNSPGLRPPGCIVDPYDSVHNWQVFSLFDGGPVQRHPGRRRGRPPTRGGREEPETGKLSEPSLILTTTSRVSTPVPPRQMGRRPSTGPHSGTISTRSGS